MEGRERQCRREKEEGGDKMDAEALLWKGVEINWFSSIV